MCIFTNATQRLSCSSCRGYARCAWIRHVSAPAGKSKMDNTWSAVIAPQTSLRFVRRLRVSSRRTCSFHWRVSRTPLLLNYYKLVLMCGNFICLGFPRRAYLTTSTWWVQRTSRWLRFCGQILCRAACDPVMMSPLVGGLGRSRRS